MARFETETRETTARVKGGMPVTVTGSYERDDSGAYVDAITVAWASSGKPVTKAFEASLTGADWDAIVEAIAEA